MPTRRTSTKYPAGSYEVLTRKELLELAERQAQEFYGQTFAEVCRRMDTNDIEDYTIAYVEMRGLRFLLGDYR